MSSTAAPSPYQKFVHGYLLEINAEVEELVLLRYPSTLARDMRKHWFIQGAFNKARQLRKEAANTSQTELTVKPPFWPVCETAQIPGEAETPADDPRGTADISDASDATMAFNLPKRPFAVASFMREVLLHPSKNAGRGFKARKDLESVKGMVEYASRPVDAITVVIPPLNSWTPGGIPDIAYVADFSTRLSGPPDTVEGEPRPIVTQHTVARYSVALGWTFTHLDPVWGPCREEPQSGPANADDQSTTSSIATNVSTGTGLTAQSGSATTNASIAAEAPAGSMAPLDAATQASQSISAPSEAGTVQNLADDMSGLHLSESRSSLNSQ